MADVEPFKVNDTVYVHNRYHGYTGPYMVEKIHKGNGNAIVDGTQYHANGHEAGQWASGRIYHATPKLTIKINKIKKSRVVVKQLDNLTTKKIFHADDALVDELLILIAKFNK